MVGIHTEGAFEAAVESHLLANGYISGSTSDFDLAAALDPVQLFAFIEATQPDAWAALEKLDGAEARAKFLQQLVKRLSAAGSLDVWRRGFKHLGQTIRLAYFKPSTQAGPELLARYAENRLSVVRQLRYDAAHNNTLDLCILLNGIPLVTIELKNHATGQSVDDAVKQYRFDRHPADQIFRYTERALVHFAVDDAGVQMTTRLEASDTFFLPFNKGDNGGAGNPENPGGYRTAYLWEEVLERDSLLDIVARFIGIEYDDPGAKNVPKHGRVVFPRYHQLEVVRSLEADARESGPGSNYLVMHSTGSGKSLSIAWAAHRLYSLHDEADERVFHSVVVVTDRVVLNRQLQDTIYGIDHKHGVVERIEGGSSQLADALEKGAPIIITTLQTFPFVAEKIAALPSRNYAVIVDEAHSSQTGISAAKLKAVLAGWEIPDPEVEDSGGDEGSVDLEAALLTLAKARGRQSNLSYFAFTATPKPKTMEMFGTRYDDGTFRPFHVYSMRQAIEEGFIMDVLANYTTYDRFYKLSKAIEDDPEFEKRSAAKAIAKFIELHPYNLSQKAITILDHFDTAVRGLIEGRAKAMVVTGSRIHAVKTYFALKKEVESRDDMADPGILVAFSGTVTDPDTALSYTETELNGFGEGELPKQFDGSKYRILVVAEKYQTGFDQPLLHSMYVDKKLAGVHAVQTLSRLNRRAAGKENTFVLDFVNEAEDILEAYKPYYETAVLSSATDPNLLYDLEGALRDFGVYYPEEVDEFAEILLKKPAMQEPADPGKLNSIVDKAVTRFKDMDEEAQDTFRKTLGQFVRLYAFLSNVVEWQDTDLEKLFQYSRWLVRKLPAGAGTPVLELDDDVALSAYRLKKDFEGAIVVDEAEALVPMSALGSRLTPEQYLRLSELIEAINDKFGLNLRPEDMLFFEQVGQDIMADDGLAETAKANTQDSFKYVFEELFLSSVLNRRDRNEEMLKMVLDNPEFAELIKAQMLPWVYDGLKQRTPTPELIEAGESDKIEFKSTARWNIHADKNTPEIQDAVVKTVAAFLNSGGGTLLIGVTDDGETGTLEHDVKQYKNSLDGYENWLMGSLLVGAIGKNATSYVNTSFAEIDGGTVARLDVQASPTPVWADMSTKMGVFYTRLGNATHELIGQEAFQYVQDHWKGDVV